MKVEFSLDSKDISRAIKELKAYKKSVKDRAFAAQEELAEIGWEKADFAFKTARYDGKNDVDVKIEGWKRRHAIIARGEAVAFIEFGTGAFYGYGHPLASELGMGPSTWSMGPNGIGQWDNPDGWLFQDEAGNWHRSWGNEPAMGMFLAQAAIEENAERVVKEKFK